MSRVRKSATFAAAAVALVGAWEGLQFAAYRDIVGVLTICYGDTKNVRAGQVATKAECDRRLLEQLVAHENGMLTCLRPDLPDGPHLAFLSLTYNIGVAAFCKSTLVRKANAGDLRGACEELKKFTRAGGSIIRGLILRRDAEHEICIEGLRA